MFRVSRWFLIVFEEFPTRFVNSVLSSISGRLYDPNVIIRKSSELKLRKSLSPQVTLTVNPLDKAARSPGATGNLRRSRIRVVSISLYATG